MRLLAVRGVPEGQETGEMRPHWWPRGGFEEGIKFSKVTFLIWQEPVSLHAALPGPFWLTLNWVKKKCTLGHKTVFCGQMAGPGGKWRPEMGFVDFLEVAGL
jgi:hypothetical protein